MNFSKRNDLIMQQERDETPWRPTVEPEPEFNPFVNPLDRSGEPERQPPLDNWDPDKDEPPLAG
jgi:hypothetical protein